MAIKEEVIGFKCLNSVNNLNKQHSYIPKIFSILAKTSTKATNKTENAISDSAAQIQSSDTVTPTCYSISSATPL